jgi:hypothetical protein
MECDVCAGLEHNEKDLAIAVVAAETELAASLLSLTLDFGETARRDL